MTNLNSADGYIVLINTFTVEPSRAEELLEVLSRATEAGMRQMPGFVSANLHVSHDKRHVANYAQWQSVEAYQAMFEDPRARAHMSVAAEIATSFEPQLYTVESVHLAPNV